MNEAIEIWMLSGLAIGAVCLAYAFIIEKESPSRPSEPLEFIVLSLVCGPLILVALIMYLRDKKTD